MLYFGGAHRNSRATGGPKLGPGGGESRVGWFIEALAKKPELEEKQRVMLRGRREGSHDEKM